MERLKLRTIEKILIIAPDILLKPHAFQGMTFALIRDNSRSMVEILSSR